MGRRATLAILATLGTWVYVGAAEVKIEVHDHQVINFTVGKSLVTNYHIDPEAAKPFFWPLNAPNGVPVTRPWPMVPPKPGEQTDHVHQKSGWFTYGDVIPEGVEIKQKIKGIKGVDFWSKRRVTAASFASKSASRSKPRITPASSPTTNGKWPTA